MPDFSLLRFSIFKTASGVGGGSGAAGGGGGKGILLLKGGGGGKSVGRANEQPL